MNQRWSAAFRTRASRPSRATSLGKAVVGRALSDTLVEGSCDRAERTSIPSRARGEGDEESDLDVLVCVRDLTRSERREALDVVYDLELALGVRIDLILRDAEPAALGAALASEILRDGVAV